MYIDPNTGGILFQVLATSFAVLSGAALLFSRQIRAAFARAMRFLRDLRGRGKQGGQPAETRSDDVVIQGKGEGQ
jgi:hypothetical protein